MDRVNGIRITAEVPVETAKPNQAQRSDTQAHDRAAIEGDCQSASGARGLRGVSRSNVGLGGRKHTQIASQCRGECTDCKRQSRIYAQWRHEQDEE